jgi:hypothetical protein
MLAGWARTGWWAHPGAAEELEIGLGGSEDVGEAPGDTASAAGLSITARAQAVSDAAAAAAAADGEVMVTLQLKGGGLIVARMYLSRATWLPARMVLRVCGDEEKWFFSDWQRTVGADGRGRGGVYPMVSELKGAAGGVQTFRVTSTRANAGVKAEWFAKPGAGAGIAGASGAGGDVASAFVNRGSVRYDDSEQAEVRIEKARSSHVLVRPLVDGVDVGPFILDTGASGLVISSKAAAKLDLRAFGEVFVSGVAGKVPCRFRRAEELKLGPITIDRPVFMEMDVGGIVSGSSEPVAGIVGFDAFKSTILEVGPGGSPVRLYDLATFQAPESWTWQPLLMVGGRTS